MGNNKILKNSFLLGQWSAFIITILGIAYFLAVVFLIFSGKFVLPPPAFIQDFAAIVDLIICPLIIIMMNSIHYIVSEERKVFSNVAVLFSTLFTIFVYINRICQLTVVKRSIEIGQVEGINWFLPYEPHSIMFALEITGFSFFLSLTMFFAALSLKGTVHKSIIVVFLTYAILGFISFFGFIFNNLLINIGFIAWGFVLYIGTGLLYRFFSIRYKEKN